MASAAADGVKIWDLRKKTCTQTIYAHTNSVSCVKFQPASTRPATTENSIGYQGGTWLLSTSHDHSAKIWGAYDWKCLVTLSAHDNKIASADISTDSKFICTAGFDRSIKLWACPS